MKHIDTERFNMNLFISFPFSAKIGPSKTTNKGIRGFKRYIAIGIVSFNIHKLGAIIQEQETKKDIRRKKYNKTYSENRKYQAARKILKINRKEAGVVHPKNMSFGTFYK
jgi:hypothetical protein